MPNDKALGQAKEGMYNPIEWETFGHRNNDPTDLAYNRVEILETVPTDGANSNGSLVLTYDGNSNLQTIEKTIDGVTYTKTFTFDGNSNLTDVSAWS